MTGAQRGLAVRRAGTTLATFHETLEELAAKYRAEEVLTAVRHIPAREAQFRAMPEWVRPELAAAYRGERHREALFASGGGGGTGARGEEFRGGDADGFGQNALLQPAGAECGAGERGHARAVPLPDQGAGAGPAGGTARPGEAAG